MKNDKKKAQGQKRDAASPRRVERSVKPDFMDSALWRFNKARGHWTLGDMAQHIEDLEACIALAAPLAWVFGERVTEAAEWEKKAHDLILKA